MVGEHGALPPSEGSAGGGVNLGRSVSVLCWTCCSNELFVSSCSTTNPLMKLDIVNHCSLLSDKLAWVCLLSADQPSQPDPRCKYLGSKIAPDVRRAGR